MASDTLNSNDAPVSSPPSPSGHENHAFSTDEDESNTGKLSLRTRTATTLSSAFKGEEIPGKNDSPLEEIKETELLYTVNDAPAWYTCILLGMQHFLTMVGSTISIPYILTPLLCMDDSDPARGKIVCTILFVSGMITFLQSTVGVRLPIIQGGTFSFLVPTVAIITTNFEPCSDVVYQNMTSSEIEEVWQVRMREIQGAIAVAAVVQVVIGFSGLMGIILMWITPLTIVPTVTLVGLSLYSVAADKASLHWGVALLTLGLLMLFSQYLKEIPVPIPAYNKGSGWTFSKIYIFKLFPVIMAILLSWAFCAILTAANVFPEGNKARTDINSGVIGDSPWFRFPYPGQWGLPTVSVAGALGMMAGVIASMIESVGDYYACARIAGAPPPPVHAINRGIAVEGIGCILAGLWGSGNGTTSYSENIGAIGVTKVGSRRVVQYAAIIMMLFGVVGKFGAVMVTMPEPIVGGVFIVMFSMITAVGLSTLQYVDLSSARNLFVIGFSIFFGLALPTWMANNSDAIKTGSEIVDQILSVLLQTSMLIGGLLGFILDNTIPGTPKERGLLLWNSHMSSSIEKGTGTTDCYEIPLVMDSIRKVSWTKYLPFCPNFVGCCRKEKSLNV